MFKYFGPLFNEKDDQNNWNISIGRFSWWVVLLPALYIWIKYGGERDIPSGHLTILITLTTYNFTKKAIKVADNVWGNKNNPEKNE